VGATNDSDGSFRWPCCRVVRTTLWADVDERALALRPEGHPSLSNGAGRTGWGRRVNLPDVLARHAGYIGRAASELLPGSSAPSAVNPHSRRDSPRQLPDPQPSSPRSASSQSGLRYRSMSQPRQTDCDPCACRSDQPAEHQHHRQGNFESPVQLVCQIGLWNEARIDQCAERGAAGGTGHSSSGTTTVGEGDR
jgi:hypothetical protein